MKKYKLLQWYPSIPNMWTTEDKYYYDIGRKTLHNLTRESEGLYPMSVTLYPYHLKYQGFWQLIDDKNPLFTTDDGVDMFDETDCLFIVNKQSDKYKVEIGNIYDKSNRQDFKYFFHESDADEYIAWHKKAFSVNDLLLFDLGISTSNLDKLQQIAKERCK